MCDVPEVAEGTSDRGSGTQPPVGKDSTRTRSRPISAGSLCRTVGKILSGCRDGLCVTCPQRPSGAQGPAGSGARAPPVPEPVLPRLSSQNSGNQQRLSAPGAGRQEVLSAVSADVDLLSLSSRN